MDANFKVLLIKYLHGKCTPAEREQVNRWYAMIEDKSLEISEEERSEIGARMLSNIGRLAQEGNPRKSAKHHLLSPMIYKVAASLTLLAVFALWYFSDSREADNLASAHSFVTADRIVYENSTDKVQVYKLPDNSIVKLEGLSTLRFGADFSKGDREVYLTGKAFFDVTKSESTPFYVYSGQVATRVLGTSFFVDAREGAEKIEIEVVTGKVSVFEFENAIKGSPPKSAAGKSLANGVVLSRNQKVEYIIEGGHWVTGLVKDPSPLRKVDEVASPFVFSNTPVGEIVSRMSALYAIEIIPENERITECTFTGDVSLLPLYDMLDVVCNAIGSSYEVKGTRILITGNGCGKE